jgi:hypothetical protein
MTKEKEVEIVEEPLDLEVVKEKIVGMKKMVEDTKVEDDEQLEEVANKIKAIKDMGKLIKSEKDKFEKPAKEIIAASKEKYDPYAKECVAAEMALKSKAGEYMDKVEKKRREEEAKIAARVEKGTLREETGLRKMEAIGEEKKTVKTFEGAKLTRKTIKDIEVEDINKIPDEYWVVDMVKVKKVALAGVVVPGVKVVERKITSL